MVDRTYTICKLVVTYIPLFIGKLLALQDRTTRIKTKGHRLKELERGIHKSTVPAEETIGKILKLNTSFDRRVVLVKDTDAHDYQWACGKKLRGLTDHISLQIWDKEIKVLKEYYYKGERHVSS